MNIGIGLPAVIPGVKGVVDSGVGEAGRQRGFFEPGSDRPGGVPEL